MARMTPWREWLGAPRGAALAALVVSVAAMTAATFAAPLRPRARYWRGTDGTQVEREARLAKAYYRNAGSGARRVQLRDSLRTLARPGVTVRIDRQLDPVSASRLERRIRLAWAAFDIDAPRIPIVLAGIAARGNEPFGVSSFAVLPASANEPCLVVVSSGDMWMGTTADARVAQDARWLRNVMFGCALHARLGLPGAAVAAELRRVGWSPDLLHFQRGSNMFWWSGRSTLQVAQHASPWFLPYFACAAGRVPACVERAELSSSRSRERPAYMWSVAGRMGIEPAGRSLLALLQVSLKQDDFAQLWRDERPFDEALSAITGRHLDDWVHQVVLRGTRPLDSSFSPVSPIVARALIFFVLAAITGVALHTRRRITP